MGTQHWRPVGLADVMRLRETRLQAHYAAQWLARVARAYLPPQPDDSHTNFGWDDAFDGFIAHPLPGGMRLGLRIPDLTLTLSDRDGKSLPLPLVGRCDAEIGRWLGRQMQLLGLPSRTLDCPPPYTLPPHPLAQGVAYHAGAFTELAAWFANGAAALNALRQRLRARGLAAPEVRCWPHHFDLDCLTVIGRGAPYAAPTMGAGFSPGDFYYDEPYFYISVYPRLDRSALPALPPPGHWHTEDFLAAIVPASRIVWMKDRQTETEAFLQSAADAIVDVLGAVSAARAN